LGSRRQHFKEKLLNTDRIQVGRDMISSLWSGMKELLNKILAGVGKVTGLVVDSASASTGGGGGGYTAAAERMRRMSIGGASGARRLARPVASVHRHAAPAVRRRLRAPGGARPSVGGRYSAADAAALIRRVGGTAAEARILGAISQPESGGNPRAHNRNARTDDNSYGLWQINMLGRMVPQRRRRFGISSNADLFNLEVNARIALKMHRMARSFRDWSTFRNGRHLRYLAAASGGTRARGGPVHAVQSYVVGEQGWEIYRPSKSGEIVSQKQLAAESRNAAHGGQTIHFAPTIHFNGATDPQQVANQVERHIRSKLGLIFRGSHSDIGFAPI
jgi:hypothetical protein